MAPPVLCVVGAGTAGLEALLAAREQLRDDVSLCLIAPDREFRYRPMSRDSLFRPARERAVSIADLASEAGVSWIQDRAAAVHQDQRCVVTRDGDEIGYDFLLLAPGGRQRRALHQGYLWQRGGDPAFLDQILHQLSAAEISSVAIAIPRGARWPVPAYELALVLAWSTPDDGARIELLTAEDRPLAALGTAATELVRSELEAAGVQLSTGVELIDAPHRTAQPAPVADLIIVPESSAAGANALVGSPTDPARVRLGTGDLREYERLISLPTVVGPGIAGIAHDAAGFVQVDAGLHVCGADSVWAVGGCIAAGLEHSALSAQQADVAVARIAARLRSGSDVPDAPELTGFLLSGQRLQWLAENPPGTPEPSTRCLWWPPGRAVGRMLARRIAAWDPTVGIEVPFQLGGTAVCVPLALGDEEPVIPGSGAVTAAVRDARVHDLEQRQLMAVERHERELAAELDAMTHNLDAMAKRHAHVSSEIRGHGYLWGRS